MERVSGIEPPCPPWQGGVLPLNYTRKWRFRRDSNPLPSPWQGDMQTNYTSEPHDGEEGGIWTPAPVSRPMPLAGAPLRPLEYFFSLPIALTASQQCLNNIPWGIRKRNHKFWSFFFTIRMLQNAFVMRLPGQSSSYRWKIFPSVPVLWSPV